MPYSDVYEHSLVAQADAIDENGHVNNVAYVRWMQDAATAHSGSVGATRAVVREGATWVVRSHRIEYLRPVMESDRLTVQTWIEDVENVRSTRRYRFIRDRDDREVARGETLWVCVDASTGRPSSIPLSVLECFKS
ncbi:MAG: acyl-CoA thioesterase [Rhodothermales bacterium]|nr:acyl-CoA thioesterase [Rhodothermales bacterium]